MRAIDCKAYKYCKANIRLKTTPHYVKLQMRDFMRLCEGKSNKYVVSVTKIEQIEGLLKLLIMPKGLRAGSTLYDCSAGYQWLVYTASLAVVYKDNSDKRRYETVLLKKCSVYD